MKLITDRTKADVLLGTEKGRYGAADLNRVEGAVAELVRLGRELDISTVTEIKTDWAQPGAFSPSQWPAKGQMARYLGNVCKLCDAVAIAADLPSGMEHLTWEGANRIEQALELVYIRIQAILQVFQFSGEIFAGEENDL